MPTAVALMRLAQAGAAALCLRFDTHGGPVPPHAAGHRDLAGHLGVQRHGAVSGGFYELTSCQLATWAVSSQKTRASMSPPVRPRGKNAQNAGTLRRLH